MDREVGGDGRPRRFAGVVTRDDKRRRRRVPIAIAAGVVLVGAGVGIAAAVSGGSADHRAALESAGSARVQHLPGNLRALPAVQPGVIGVIEVLRPSSATITRDKALADYRHLRGALRLQGRTVKTALARVAYIEDGRERQTTVWIISVWYHPANIGIAHQRQWCVTHQLLTAANGYSFYAVTGSCLPVGRHPVDVTAQRTT